MESLWQIICHNDDMADGKAMIYCPQPYTEQLKDVADVLPHCAKVVMLSVYIMCASHVHLMTTCPWLLNGHLL